jgi:radical SAM protein with 4Fe4S-binding SPASM domain
MQEIQYKTFSWRTHKKNWRIKKPNVCQFELTFKCGLHCTHCYSDCYNKSPYIKKELSARQVKLIIDKMHRIGVVWLCFTGGDPLTRDDFLELYSYAKDKGFIITIFTNGCSMTKEIADYFVKRPPFVIELTINGITQKTYEKISRIKGSYSKAMAGLEMLLKRKLPLKVKTMATKQNIGELSEIKQFLESKGLKFRPSVLLHAGLNSDIAPCKLRLKSEEVIALDKMFTVKSMEEDSECLPIHNNGKKGLREENRLFRCAAGGGDGINIDPYGKMFMCTCLREPAIDLLQARQADIEKALFDTFPNIADRKFETSSKCRYCDIVDLCYFCPGNAYLETGNMEEPVEWFCELAKARVGIL